jgi:hypothetical protein
VKTETTSSHFPRRKLRHRNISGFGEVNIEVLIYPTAGPLSPGAASGESDGFPWVCEGQEMVKLIREDGEVKSWGIRRQKTGLGEGVTHGMKSEELLKKNSRSAAGEERQRTRVSGGQSLGGAERSARPGWRGRRAAQTRTTSPRVDPERPKSSPAFQPVRIALRREKRGVPRTPGPHMVWARGLGDLATVPAAASTRLCPRVGAAAPGTWGGKRVGTRVQG